jgi:hypothetical protein
MRETVHVVIDGDTFPTVHRRADTAVFRPTTVRSGTYPITLVPSVRPAADSPDAVTVRGFAACYHGPPMTGYALPWPERYQLSTFVADGAESAIIVDAATGQSRPAVPPSAHHPGLGTGPGWAYEPLSFVLSGTLFEGFNDATCLWRLAPSPERGECWGESPRFVSALLGPGMWVIGHSDWTYRTFGPDQHVLLAFATPEGITVSPRGDYAIVSGYSPEGQLLIPVAESEPVARIPSLIDALAPAAFTLDGDTVYMAGMQQGDRNESLVVFKVRSPTHLIATADLGRVGVNDLAVDPVAPYLYVLASRPLATITVLDRATLFPVASLRPDSGCPDLGEFQRLRLARNLGALYVIGSNERDGSSGRRAPRSSIVRYDLLPPADVR